MAERYINIKTDVIDEYTPTKDTFDNYKNYVMAKTSSYDATTKVLTIDVGSNVIIKSGLMIGFRPQNDSESKTNYISINNTNFYYYEDDNGNINNRAVQKPISISKSIYTAVAGGYAIISIDPSTQSYTVVNEIMRDSAEGNYLPLTGGTLSGLLTLSKTDATDSPSSALLSIRSNKFPNSTRYTVDDKGIIRLFNPIEGNPYLYFNPNTNHLYMRKDADISSGISMDYNTTTPTIEFLGTTGGKITNLATPTNNTDAANKAYVDIKSGGLRCYYFNDAHFQTTVSKWDPDTNSTLTLDFLEYERYDVLKEAVLAKDIYDAIVITFSIDNYYTNAIFIRLNPSTNNGFVATQTTIKTAHGNRFVTMKLDENSLEITASSLKLKKQVTATIPVIGWGGSSSGRSYTLSISNITSDSVVYITPQYTVDNYEAVSAAWSSISFAETGANKITFYIVGGQQPTTAIPLQITWED